MRRMIVSLFAVAIVVALANSVMAVGVPGNTHDKPHVVANGIYFESVNQNDDGNKEAWLTIEEGADVGTLWVTVKDVKAEEKFVTSEYDTTVPGVYGPFITGNGNITYDWEPAPVVCEHAWVETQTATCVTGGWIMYICSECGEEGEQIGWEGALGHDWNYDNRIFANESWDIVYCDRCGEWTYTESLALIAAKEHLAEWLEKAKTLSNNFEVAGIPGNGGNVALIDATETAEYHLNNASGLAAINEVTQALKDAYWAALEAYNLVFAAVDLGNWINYASDRIKYLKNEGLWDTEPCQDLYYYMVEYYHNVYLPAYNWGIGTSAEVNAALQTLKDAYWATY